ncbi:MAG: prephenate dehydrogenase [Flavobacteriaceae bacterium]|jgi:prephenate dehydrogenase|tara:strand:+ start:8753 stop:9619 length:867 start_codon:yes stop_codon:yes gene_type:complete
MRIGIIGLGLIGGSFALAAKKYTVSVKLYGQDHNPEHVKEALSLGIIDQQLEEHIIPEMDVIILAIPVDASLDIAITILDKMNDNALLMDVGSTKAAICNKLALHSKRNQFLATHPIAGTEFSGPSAAFSELFAGEAQILCEANKTRPDLLEWAMQWFRNMNMNVDEMEAEAHDKHIAYVSHISHISSFMLGKTVMEKEQDERTIFKMAGSGFASTVRLAKSSPAMWTPILKQNKENILEVLREYISNLENFEHLLKTDDYEPIFEQMKSTNAIKTILAGINKKNITE